MILICWLITAINYAAGLEISGHSYTHDGYGEAWGPIKCSRCGHVSGGNE